MRLVSAVKAVVQVVRDLDEARRLYERGFGLTCIGETEISLADVAELWGVAAGNFRAARFARAGEEFGCVDLVANAAARKPLRDARRAFDFGIMTLNFRTHDLAAAIGKLAACGAAATTEILRYDVGKPMREVMMIAASGERLTVLEVGGKDESLPVFDEAIATVGLVTPSLAEAQFFYERGLGFQTAIAFQAAGPPFDRLLGVQELRRMDFATLTAGGNWTGKVELLELSIGGAQAARHSAPSDFFHTGYTLVTFLADDLDAVADSCRNTGAEIVAAPHISNRPFHEGQRAMLARAPGGEYLEIIES